MADAITECRDSVAAAKKENDFHITEHQKNR